MKKRLMLYTLRKHDLDHDTCYVRELEMIADAAILDRGSVVQFWTDVQVYGLREAILLVRSNAKLDAREFELLIIRANQILEIFGAQKYGS